jgi:hypothetical protein
MSAFAEAIRFDLISMIEEDPVNFIFAGTEYVGASSGINRSAPLEIGGFEDRPELKIAINLRDIDGSLVFGQDRPKVNDRITVGGKTYRIDRTEIDSLEECLQMDLRSKDK